MEEYRIETGFLKLCWEELLTLIELNLLFLLCCCPVFTIPAAITALSRACQDCLLGKGQLFRAFLHSFRRNLTAALPLGGVFLVMPAGLLYGCVFYYRLAAGNFLWLICSLFCLIGAYVLFCASALGFHIIARVELTAGAAVRDAFVLLFLHPQLLFTWLLLAVLIPAAAVWLFPGTLPVLLLLTWALSALASARGTVLLICRCLLKKRSPDFTDPEER